MFRHAENILRKIARRYGISVDEIRGNKRSRTFSRARGEVMYDLREETTLSYREIGIVLGGRDASTIIRGLKRWQHVTF